jgi:putative phosphoesterase
MRIGLVSDTHMPRFGAALPMALSAGLQGVSTILHCGDMTDVLIVELFEAIAPFEAVAGNNDDAAIRARFGRRKVVEIDGVRIGMIHGDHRSKPTEQYAFEAFSEESVDAIVFGHSHRPIIKERAGIIMINPGSPTDKRFNPLYSYAILEIADGKLKARLHYYLSRATER